MDVIHPGDMSHSHHLPFNRKVQSGNEKAATDEESLGCDSNLCSGLRHVFDWPLVAGQT